MLFYSYYRYGNENEPMAKRDFEKKFDVKIEPAGLYLYTQNLII